MLKAFNRHLAVEDAVTQEKEIKRLNHNLDTQFEPSQLIFNLTPQEAELFATPSEITLRGREGNYELRQQVSELIQGLENPEPEPQSSPLPF